MNKYYDPNLCQETLETYQGYSLQVFTSGRIKLSFHITHRYRNEYYAARPNRFREAYAEQPAALLYYGLFSAHPLMGQRSRLYSQLAQILPPNPVQLIHLQQLRFFVLLQPFKMSVFKN
jgi:hypothetical protein